MPLTPAIAPIPLDRPRSLEKSRRSGMTMVSDHEMSLPALTGLLDVAGAYIDDLQDRPRKRLRFSTRASDREIGAIVRPRRVFASGWADTGICPPHNGIDPMQAQLSKAPAVGFDMMETSDNIVELDAGTLNRVLAMVRDLGLSPVEEIGDKREKADPEAMLAQVNAVLAAGARDEVLILKDNCDTSRCMFKRATPRVGATTVQIFACKKGLMKAFGADVHIGNLTNDTDVETESTRLGPGSAGPFSCL